MSEETSSGIDINELVFNPVKKRNDEAAKIVTGVENDEPAEEEKPEPEVRLISAQWRPGPKGFINNEQCFLDVKAEYLKKSARARIRGKLFGTYEGVEEDLGQEVEGFIEDNGIASMEVKKLWFINNLHYNSWKKDKSVKCSYKIKGISHSRGANEIESPVLEMPAAVVHTVQFLEMVDSIFHHRSAVPFLDSSGVLTNGLAAVFVRVEQNAGKEVVLYGHTDTSGEPDYNYDLSRKRAEALKALLDNNREDWKRSVDFSSKVEDYQATLKALSQTHGWPTDPGKVDNISGQKTAAAVKAFQSEYNERFDGSLVVDGIMGPNTWGAVFDVLRSVIESSVKKQTGGDIPAITYAYGGDAVYPCGESFPIEAAQNSNYRSKTNRRVEIIFFDQGSTPPRVTPADKTSITKEEVPVYDESKYKREPFPDLASPAPDGSSEVVLDEVSADFAPSIEPCIIDYHLEDSEPLTSGKATITIQDNTGAVIFEKDDLPLEKGKTHSYDWDGKAGDGTYPPAGSGPFQITVSQTGEAASTSSPRDSAVSVMDVELVVDGVDSSNRLVVNDPALEPLVTATVYFKKSDGTKVITEVPAKVEFTFTDPGTNNITSAASFSYAAGRTLGKRGVAGAKYWKAHPSFVATSSDSFQTDCTVETEIASGSADKGKAKAHFLPSGVGRDNYKVTAKVFAPDGTTVLGQKDVTFEVWRKISYNNVHTVNGEAYIDAATVHAQIGPAFETTGANGAYVLYERGTVQTLPAALTVRYIGLYDAASPTHMANWPDDFSPANLETAPNQLNPTAAELTDYAYAGADPALLAKKNLAQAAITAKAQLWFNRVDTDLSTRSWAWFTATGVGGGNALLAVQYYHPKLSNQGADGATNFYPAGITINLANPGSGLNTPGDPDQATWRIVQGFNIGTTSVIFKNYGTAARLQVVCRHEIGHATGAAFRRASFGTGDHSGSGLMTPWGAGASFSNADSQKLRGEL